MPPTPLNEKKKLRPLYDIHSRCVALLCDAKRATIHQQDGKLLAEIDDDAVFSTDGRHIGWLIRGQIYDRKGKLVLARQAMGAAHVSHTPSTLDREPRCGVAKRETVKNMPRFENDEWADLSGLPFFGVTNNLAARYDGEAKTYPDLPKLSKTSRSSAPPPP